jgi:hypothetical protein
MVLGGVALSAARAVGGAALEQVRMAGNASVVRFRQTSTTLHFSLVETRREGSASAHGHIAGFGSVPDPASIADRVAFWADLHDRLDRLGNRLGPDLGKVMGMVHDRVPMPTPDEQRELQLENARADERLYSGLADWHADTAAGRRLWQRQRCG